MGSFVSYFQEQFFFSLKNKKTLKAYMVKSGLSYYFLV